MSFLDIIKNNNDVKHFSNLLAGVDLGYGQIKILSGDMRTKFLSAVGTPISDFGRTAAISSEKELLNALAITLEGKKYYIGHNAIINTRNGRLSLKQNKAESEENKIKLLTALALFTKQNQNEAQFDIVTGLPVLEYKGQKDKLYNMIYNYNRPFEFTMHYGPKKIQKLITINNVQIISQGEGAFYDFVLDSQGNIIKEHQSLVSGQVMVVDPGYRTTDIVTMENGRYIEPMSTHLKKGVNQIHQEVLRLIMNKLNIKLEIGDMDKIVREGKLYYGTQEHNIVPIIEQAVKPFAEDIVDNLITTSDEKLPFMQRVLLTGGGAALIYPYVKSLLKETINVTLLDNAEYSNVSGYYKYGLLLKNSGVF